MYTFRYVFMVLYIRGYWQICILVVFWVIYTGKIILLLISSAAVLFMQSSSSLEIAIFVVLWCCCNQNCLMAGFWHISAFFWNLNNKMCCFGFLMVVGFLDLLFFFVKLLPIFGIIATTFHFKLLLILEDGSDSPEGGTLNWNSNSAVSNYTNDMDIHSSSCC